MLCKYHREQCHAKPKHIANMVVLVTKQYVYRQRCLKKPMCKYELGQIVFGYRNIEKYYSIKLDKHVQFRKRWENSIPQAV